MCMLKLQCLSRLPYFGRRRFDWTSRVPYFGRRDRLRLDIAFTVLTPSFVL